MLKKSVLGLVISSLLLSACATDQYGRPRDMNNTEKGAIMGTLGGAVAGALINHKNRGKGALIGAIGGGLAGTAIGAYMDNQAKDFTRSLTSEIQSGAITVVKNADHSIVVTMTDSTAFDVNSYAIKGGFYPTMNKIADIVNKYGKTTLTITGHTDSSGSDRINQPLSQNRAKAVNDYLEGRNVAQQRLSYYGLGAQQPRASNATEAGKRLNRRVEILIQAVQA